MSKSKKKTRKPLYERLKNSLHEGIEFSKGKLNLRTVEFPEEPPEVSAETVLALRESTEMSQAVFAKLLNVSKKTVQSWEQGLRKPSQASRRLLQVFSQHPEIVCRIAGMSGRTFNDVTEETTVNGKRQLVVKKRGRRKTQTA